MSSGSASPVPPGADRHGNDAYVRRPITDADVESEMRRTGEI